jgi:hypothetical protein
MIQTVYRLNRLHLIFLLSWLLIYCRIFINEIVIQRLIITQPRLLCMFYVRIYWIHDCFEYLNHLNCSQINCILLYFFSSFHFFKLDLQWRELLFQQDCVHPNVTHPPSTTTHVTYSMQKHIRVVIKAVFDSYSEFNYNDTLEFTYVYCSV